MYKIIYYNKYDLNISIYNFIFSDTEVNDESIEKIANSISKLN